jgi:hypothetical protein
VKEVEHVCGWTASIKKNDEDYVHFRTQVNTSFWMIIIALSHAEGKNANVKKCSDFALQSWPQLLGMIQERIAQRKKVFQDKTKGTPFSIDRILPEWHPERIGLYLCKWIIHHQDVLNGTELMNPATVLKMHQTIFSAHVSNVHVACVRVQNTADKIVTSVSVHKWEEEMIEKEGFVALTNPQFGGHANLHVFDDEKSS